MILIMAVAVTAGLLGSCAGRKHSVGPVANMSRIPAEPAAEPTRKTSEPAPEKKTTEAEKKQPEDKQQSPENARPASADAAAANPGQAPATEAKTEAAPAAQSKSQPHVSARSKPARRSSGLKGEVAYAKAAGKKIALTLDAGASAAPTSSILDTLKANGLRVTFFLTGKWCEDNEVIVKRIANEGHEIANHTYSHPDLRKLSEDKIVDQLARTNNIIVRITGHGCAPYFRAPFGARDSRVLEVAKDAGYRSIYWSLDSWDAFKKNVTSKEISDRVLGRLQDGDIVLMHCGSKPTADALPGLISEIQARGYEIVTVSELIDSAGL